MKKCKAISMVGCPGSGKSTLASQINSILKARSKNSVFVEEYVVEYIAEYDIPTEMEQQLIIFDEQYRKERMFSNAKDFIICDSASWVSYVYGKLNYKYPLSRHQIAALTHMHKKVLESLNYWDYIFYVPPIINNYSLDGVRYHEKEDSLKIDKMIKAFLDLEGVPYIDLSNIELSERRDFVLKHIQENT